MENRSIRLIDDLGRIVLPKEIRTAMDWGIQTPVEIRFNPEEREVVLKTFTYACIYCGNTENLKEFFRTHICAGCRQAIANL